MNCCHAWAQGLEPKSGNYEDHEFERALEIIKAKEEAALTTSD